MRKYAVAALIGLSLLGTQVAASEGSVMASGDRIGSPAATSNDVFMSQNAFNSISGMFGGLFGTLYVLGFITIVAYAADDDGGTSASP